MERRPRRTLRVLAGLVFGLGVLATAHAGTLSREWAGTWQIRTDLGAPGITALTDTQAGHLIGKTILLEAHRAVFAAVACEDPHYQARSSKVDDLLLEYRVDRSQIPLLGISADVLDVQCRDATSHQLIRLSGGCVVTVWEGRFFQLLKRARGSPHRVPVCVRTEK